MPEKDKRDKHLQDQIVPEELMIAKEEYRVAFFDVTEDISKISREELESLLKRFKENPNVDRTIRLEIESERINDLRTDPHYDLKGILEPNPLVPIDDHLSNAFTTPVKLSHASFRLNYISLFVEPIEEPESKNKVSPLITGSDGKKHSKHVYVIIDEAKSYVDPFAGPRSELEPELIRAFGKLFQDGNDPWARNNIDLVFSSSIVPPM